uniref:NADH dehydrogenase subunit 6 n=1 Tax=Lumbriclymenella robusta TaxID=3138170 RepID=A0AB38ZG19_9ANNE
MFSIALHLPLTVSPLGLGLWVLILALMTSLMLFFSLSSWFGLIVFLIYIGGLLVMFAYFTAIDPNKVINLISPSFIPLFILLSISAMLSDWTWATTIMDFSISPTSIYSLFFSLYTIPLLMILTMVLLMILIAVVKITVRTMGPLRPFM